jgi:hypothetical protein
MPTTTSLRAHAAAGLHGTRPADVFVTGAWRPAAADALLSGHERWHEPWVRS